MPLDWSPLVDLLRRHERPLLMTHVRPDADGMGAQLALHDALAAIGKYPRVAIASKLLPRYEFLDPKRTVIEDFKPAAFTDRDCVVILDTGTWNQLGDFGDWLRKSPLPRAVVDHHRTQDDLGGLQLVDTTAEAAGRLAHELIRALGAPLSAAAANHLFMAVATDTGWFRHPNATAQTFALCGELVAAGANPTALYEQLYEAASLARFKLTAVALERLGVRANGKIGFTEIALADYEKTGSVPGDTEDLINYPRSVEGVELALVFIEQPGGGTKVSFRSRAADVSKLAEKWGGGGHKLASGARLGKPLAEGPARRCSPRPKPSWRASKACGLVGRAVTGVTARPTKPMGPQRDICWSGTTHSLAVRWVVATTRIVRSGHRGRVGCNWKRARSHAEGCP